MWRILALALLGVTSAARAEDIKIEGRIDGAGGAVALDNGNRIFHDNMAGLGVGCHVWAHGEDEGINVLYGFSTDLLLVGRDFLEDSYWGQARGEIGGGVYFRKDALRIPFRVSWHFNYGVGFRSGWVATAGLNRDDGWSGELGAGTVSAGSDSGWRLQAAVRRRVGPESLMGVQFINDQVGGEGRPWAVSRWTELQFFYAYVHE